MLYFQPLNNFLPKGRDYRGRRLVNWVGSWQFKSLFQFLVSWVAYIKLIPDLSHYLVKGFISVQLGSLYVSIFTAYSLTQLFIWQDCLSLICLLNLKKKTQKDIKKEYRIFIFCFFLTKNSNDFFSFTSLTQKLKHY